MNMGDEESHLYDNKDTTDSDRYKEAKSELEDQTTEVRSQSMSYEIPTDGENSFFDLANISLNDMTIQKNTENYFLSSSELQDENISQEQPDSVNVRECYQHGKEFSTTIPSKGFGDKINTAFLSLHSSISNLQPEVISEVTEMSCGKGIFSPCISHTLSKSTSDTEVTRDLETTIYINGEKSRDNLSPLILEATLQILNDNPEVTADSPHIDHYEEILHWYGSVHEAVSIRNKQPEVIVEFLSTSQDLDTGKLESIHDHDLLKRPKEIACDKITIDVTKRSSVRSLNRLELAVLSVLNIFMSFFCVGSIFGLGVLFVAIIDAFQSSRAEAAPIMSVYIGITYIGGGVVGPLMNRYNGGYICMVGGVLGSIGCIISSFAPSIPYIIVGTGVLTGSAVAVGYFLPFLVTRDLFDEHRTTMLTVMDITPGLGGVIFPYMTSKLLDEYGWRGVFLIYAGLMFHCVAIGYLNAVVKRRYLTSSEIDTPFKDMFNCSLFKSATFLILLFSVMLMYTLFPAVNLFFIDMAREKGFDIQTASNILSINGLCNVAARVVIIVVTPFIKLSRMGQWTIYVPVLSLSALSYIFATTYNHLLALAVLYGAFWGLTNVSYSSAILEVSGPKNFVPALGYCSLIGGVTSLFCSPAVGALRDITGSYDSLYYLTSVLGLLSGCLLTIIRIKTYLQRRRADRKNNSTFTEKFTPKPDGVVNKSFCPDWTLTKIDAVKRSGDEKDHDDDDGDENDNTDKICRNGEVNLSFVDP